VNWPLAKPTHRKNSLLYGVWRYYGANATRHLAGPTPFGVMPRADIKTKQAVYTLSQLHAELAGKFLENSRQGVRLKTAMMQVEAVLQMLQPGFSVASIAAKRRNKSNPWFKRGTLFRGAVDVLRRAGSPMTPRESHDPDSREGRPGHP
jgi:hypothetical protein